MLDSLMKTNLVRLSDEIRICRTKVSKMLKSRHEALEMMAEALELIAMDHVEAGAIKLSEASEKHAACLQPHFIKLFKIMLW